MSPIRKLSVTAFLTKPWIRAIGPLTDNFNDFNQAFIRS
jgi:hypothetical protein